MQDPQRYEYYVITESTNIFPISLQIEALKENWHYYRHFHNVLILRRLKEN